MKALSVSDGISMTEICNGASRVQPGNFSVITGQPADHESRSTHRADQLVWPFAQPEAALSPAELFLPG